MRNVVLGTLGLVTLYLLLWPVDVEPVPWQAAPAPPLTGEFAPNSSLAAAQRIELPSGVTGPEDVGIDAAGRLYAGVSDGRILRWQPDGNGVETWADTGGRPLGLDFDSKGALLVADGVRGLLSVSPEGAVEVLTQTADDGVPIGFADDVDVGPDDRVYFSDATSHQPSRDYTLDILENRGNGRLLVHDRQLHTTRVLLSDLHFANGVAVAPSGDFVLVVETARYRVLRHWLRGDRQGEVEVWLDNLPGFPDGISSDGASTFWLALAAPRISLLDRLAPFPWARKVVARLPRLLQPRPAPFAFVLGLSDRAALVHNLQGPAGGPYSFITSVESSRGVLHLGSVNESALARLPVPR